MSWWKALRLSQRITCSASRRNFSTRSRSASLCWVIWTASSSAAKTWPVKWIGCWMLVKTRSIVRLCLFLALSLAPAFAVDWKALKPQGYVSDFAGVIDAASKAELENYATRVQQQTGAEMALVTIKSLEGEPIEDVANTIFRAWGIGKK